MWLRIRLLFAGVTLRSSILVTTIKAVAAAAAIAAAAFKYIYFIASSACYIFLNYDL